MINFTFNKFSLCWKSVIAYKYAVLIYFYQFVSFRGLWSKFNAHNFKFLIDSVFFFLYLLYSSDKQKNDYSFLLISFYCYRRPLHVEAYIHTCCQRIVNTNKKLLNKQKQNHNVFNDGGKTVFQLYMTTEMLEKLGLIKINYFLKNELQLCK